MKHCTICNKDKPIGEFYKHRKPCKRCVCKRGYQLRKLKNKCHMPVKESKICGQCKALKSYTEFFLNKDKKDGLNVYCKLCSKEVSRQAKINKYGSEVNANRHFNLKYKYNMSQKEFKELCKSQNFLCALCSKEEAKYIDHCHTSGRVRGILCNNCNTGLGKFREKPDLLKKAMEYLKCNVTQ